MQHATCSLEKCAPVTPLAMSCERVKSPNLLRRRAALLFIHVCRQHSESACSIQHTALSLQHAGYGMQVRVCSMEVTAYSIPHATYSIQRVHQTTCSILLREGAPVTPPAVSCEVQHAAYNIQHRTYEYDVFIEPITCRTRHSANKM